MFNSAATLMTIPAVSIVAPRSLEDMFESYAKPTTFTKIGRAV